MALSVGELVAYLRLDKSDYDQGMGESEQQTGRFRGALSRIRPAAMAVSAGIAAVGGAAFASAKSMADHADKVETGARQAGVSTDAYQELSHAFADFGLEQAEVDRGLGRLNQRMGRAAAGNEKYAKAFDDLGVSIQDANGDMRDTDAVMMDTIEALSQIEDPARQAAMAGELLGTRMGRKMLPALQDGSAGIEELREEARELGLVMDQESLDQANAFGDALDDFQNAARGAGLAIGTALLPVMTDYLVPAIENHAIPAIERVSGWIANAAEFFGDLPDPVQSASGAILTIGAALGPLMAILGGMAGPIMTAVSAFRALGAALLANPIGIVVGLLGLLAYGLYQAWQRSETFRDIVTGLWEGIKSAAEPVVSWFTDTVWPALVDGWERIQEAAGPVIDAVKEFLGDLFADGGDNLPVFDTLAAGFEEVAEILGQLGEIFSTTFELIREIWDEHGDAILEGIRLFGQYLLVYWSGLWEMVSGLLSGAWTIISSVISGALEIILGIINVFAGILTGDWSRAWDGIVSILSGVWTIISGVVEGALQAIGGIISGVLTWISGIWSMIWGQVSARASSAWSSITGFVSSGVSSVIGFIAGIAAVPGMVGGYFADMYQRARSRIASMVSYVRGVPGRITSALGNLGSLLVSAGRDVVQGLIDGIKDMMSNLSDAASDMASAVRDKLPFSPAREGPLRDHPPDEAGATIADMIADGLASSGAVDDAMSSLAGRMAGGVPESPEVRAERFRRGDGRGGGDGVHIDHVEVRSMGPEFSTRQVERDLAWHLGG